MPSQAVRLASVHSRRRRASEGVLAVSHQLHVGRVGAPPIAAEVVDLELGRDRSARKGVGETVGEPCLLGALRRVDDDQAVAARVESTAPFPTPTTLTLGQLLREAFGRRSSLVSLLATQDGRRASIPGPQCAGIVRRAKAVPLGWVIAAIDRAGWTSTQSPSEVSSDEPMRPALNVPAFGVGARRQGCSFSATTLTETRFDGGH